MDEEYKRKHQEKLRVAGERASDTMDEEPTQPDQRAKVPRGFSEIVAEGRRQREEALRKR